MNHFEGLNAEQVISFHRLIKIMKRLRIIGDLKTNTLGHAASSYTVEKESYDSRKISIAQEELLESIYGKLHARYPIYD